MKKIRILIPIIIFVLSITGCGTVDTTTNPSSKPGNTQTISKDPSTGEDGTTGKIKFKAEIIQTKDGLLITPDIKSNEYKSSDKMSVNLTNTVITNKDDTAIAKEDLKVGDFLEITYTGVILESYPAQISANKVKVVGHNNIIDGYLAIVEDIYQEDSGLNGDITMIALDTKKWSGLEKNEKQIIFDQMKEKYGVDIIEADYDELVKQGLVKSDKLFFEKGILITIADMKINEGKDEIAFSINKWRSGTGAIGSNEATAKLIDNKWKIKKEGMWIS